ncbi:hypothetical protein SC206_08335 [Rouxiella sp. T17]|uniref:hypothetical protein n=1 Tax=Rouxiella sp. T17 TaxID=3085684 RepID=UPI002FC606FC
MSTRKYRNKNFKKQSIKRANFSNDTEHQGTSSESENNESSGSGISDISESSNNHQMNSLSPDHITLPVNTKLSQISMLGSHDAGTYAYSRKKNDGKLNSMGALFPFAFKTQNLTLREQAEKGVKYFDIRVKKRKDGSFGFIHGGSIAGGNAVNDVNSLLEHTKTDKRNFYLLKFVIEDDKINKGTTKSDGDAFFEQTLGLDESNQIIKADLDDQNLGSATVNVLEKNKNLAIMVHKYKGNNKNYWDYKSQTNTKWPNSTSWKKTAEKITKFHKDQAPNDLINIMQTNMPAITKNIFTMGRLKKLLINGAPGIADAIDKLEHPGVISGDYIGHAQSATERFKNWISRKNNKITK